MTKTALIEKLAEELGVSKKMSGELVKALLEAMMKWVKKTGELRIQGFWNFRRVKIKWRTDYFPRNPKEKLTLPDVITVKFKAGSEFKNLVK